MYTIVSIICIFLVLTLYQTLTTIITKRRALAKAQELGCRPPPLCPNKLPFGFDHVKRALKADAAKSFPDMLVDRASEMGANTFQTNMLGNEILFTAEPKNIQALLATQFSDFCLGNVRNGNFFPLLGNGIFTQDGKEWEHSRAMLRPQFAREQISDLDLEERHVKDLMKAIPIDPISGWSKQIDLQVLFFRLTLDSATEMLFGESAGSQIAELPRKEESFSHEHKPAAHDASLFANAFDTSQKVCATRLRFADKYWLYNTAAFRSANKICHDFIDHYVEIALDSTKDLKMGDLEAGAKKDKYVFLHALVAQTRDPIELRSQLINILLAGRDTTASLLGWLFYLLARHPNIFYKLRNTVLAEFGTLTEPKEISFTKIKGCQYLQHCFSETLRLYPVVPLNIRHATKDTTLPLGGGLDGKSPIFVKKGQQVDYSVHVMHRRKDLWGPDADEFRPERWVGRKTGWEFLPFNGGPRICIGQQFALTEASYVAIRLLQRFDGIEDLLLEKKPRHNFTLTNCSASGVVVRLHEAGLGDV